METSPGSDIKTLLQYVRDSRFAHSDWREESWKDEEMYDGKQWGETDEAKAREKKVTPLTINRIFPVVNLILGQQELNPMDIVAKGRTQDDTETANIISEGIKFVMDQNEGSFLLRKAFRGAVIPGIDFLYVGRNSDPRYEDISIGYRNWRDMYWDPFSDPWLDPRQCRYVFHSPWMDLDDLIALYPEQKAEIKDRFKEITSRISGESGDDMNDTWDVSNQVEDNIQLKIGHGWTDKARRRVRPAEIHHAKFVDGLFARMPNGMVYEIKDGLPAREQYQIIQQSLEVVKARVRKIVKTVIFGDLKLEDDWSEHDHGLYPFVPVIGYLDRYNFPYGVPRQIREQNMEVNKRRSMALALLGAKRVITDSSVGETDEDMQNIYSEAQKADGFIVIEPSLDGSPVTHRISIQDQSGLSAPQLDMMSQSELEIQQISGGNPDIAYQSGEESGKALQTRQATSATVLAPLFGNLRRSVRRLGVLAKSGIQQYWTGPKVLRITDRMTGAERFVELNKRMQDPHGQIVVQNNVTQGRYDIIVSDSPATDTMREANLNLLIEWVKKSPPEIVPHLMLMAFEMSNLPNKEQLLARIKPMMGIAPGEDEMSPEEMKQQAIETLEAQKKKQAQVEQIETQKMVGEVQEQQLTNKKIEAEIAKLTREIEKIAAETKETGADTYETVVDAEAKKQQIRLNAARAKLEELEKTFGMRRQEYHDKRDDLREATQGGSTRGPSTPQQSNPQQRYS